jgi:hypothetical protein
VVALGALAAHRSTCDPHSMPRPDPIALATRGWLLVSAALAFVDAVSLGLELRLLRAIQSGELRIDVGLRETLEDAADRGEAIDWVRLALFVPTAVVYLVWLARAVRPHAEAMRTTPTRAVVEHFVPLAQLALPYRTFGRLLAAVESTSRADCRSGAGRQAERPAARERRRQGTEASNWTRFGWWTTWLATWLFAQLARNADASAVDVAGFVQATSLSLASAACALVSAVALERLVRRVSRAS